VQSHRPFALMQKVIAVCGMFVLMCSMNMLAWARAPAAIVVGVSELSDGETPANCKGVLIRGNEIFISIHNHGRLALWEGLPNHPLSCTTHVTSIGPAHYNIHLKLSNKSAEATTVYALDTGTVWWNKGKDLISAAVPGHAKQTLLLKPGASLHYISAFEQDSVKEHLHAEILIPDDKINHRSIQCEL